MKKPGFDYSRFDGIQDSDEDSDEELWRFSEAELKARRDRKKDELIQKELDGYKEIDEKLARAEKLPPRRGDDVSEAPAAPESWSDGRDTSEKKDRDARRAKQKKREAYYAVCGVLGQLADDADFQTDLQRPLVMKAIKHWTNEARLPSDEAQALFAEESDEHRFHLRPVLAKLNRLSSACKAAGFGVPMDAVWTGRRTPFKDVEIPKKPTPEEKAAAKKARARAKAEADFLKDLPPPRPFSWRSFLRQMLAQFLVMGAVMLFFKLWVEPGLREQAEAAMRAERAAAEVAAAPPGVSAGGDAEEFDLL